MCVNQVCEQNHQNGYQKAQGGLGISLVGV